MKHIVCAFSLSLIPSLCTKLAHTSPPIMDITSNASTSSSSWDLDMTMGNQLLSTDQTTPFLMVPPMDPFHLAPPSFPTSQFGVLREVGHEDDQEQQQEQDQDQEEEETLGAMKEMMYKIAAMQPVDIDPSKIKKPKRRNVRISDDPQSIAARHRRERISERIRILQRLVPGGTKMDTASMLDEAIRYVKFLKRHVQELQTNPPPVTAPHVGTGMLGGHQAGPGGWLVRPDTFHDLSSSSMGGPAGLGFRFDGAWADPSGN